MEFYFHQVIGGWKMLAKKMVLMGVLALMAQVAQGQTVQLLYTTLDENTPEAFSEELSGEMTHNGMTVTWELEAGHYSAHYTGQMSEYSGEIAGSLVMIAPEGDEVPFRVEVTNTTEVMLYYEVYLTVDNEVEDAFTSEGVEPAFVFGHTLPGGEGRMAQLTVLFGDLSLLHDVTVDFYWGEGTADEPMTMDQVKALYR
jgi:hypothetical protein